MNTIKLRPTKDAFIKAFDNLGADMGPIRIVTGTSRAGRTYVTCELA